MRPTQAFFLVTLVIGLPMLAHRALGRLAWRATAGALVFLATRPAVLMTWLIGAAGFAALLIPMAINKGNDDPATLALMGAICVLCGSGVAALTVLPVWAMVRTKTPTPTLPLDANEEVAVTLKANHVLHGESRGGTAIVTNRRLGFQPHRFNVQLDLWSLPLEQITKLERVGTHGIVVWAGDHEAAWLVSIERDNLVTRLEPLVATGQRSS
jgi:hypothetical protein